MWRPGAAIASGRNYNMYKGGTDDIIIYVGMREKL